MGVETLLSSQVCLLTLTLAAYLAARWIYRRVGFILLHPLLMAVAVVIVYLKVTGVSYELYREQTQILDFMLGVSVVALGYLLHEQIRQVKGNLTAILTAITVGSVVGIVSVIEIARWMGADELVVVSLQPKSVTMAIALGVSEASGGVPALTSIAVILVGIFGGIAGPAILRLFGIKSRIAVGLALGAGSHAMGTARAMELGAVEGAMGGLAIGLMGGVTALLVPVIEKIL